jgi:hypothetical protein
LHAGATGSLELELVEFPNPVTAGPEVNVAVGVIVTRLPPFMTDTTGVTEADDADELVVED